MISDLLKILSAIQDAKSSEEEAALRRELQQAVEVDIRAHFDNAQYPNRKRSFESIKKALGIFDDNPQELKTILYAMGARPKRGRADYWHLPKDRARSSPQQAKPMSWSRVYAGLGALAALVAILGFFGVSGADIFGGPEFTNRQECLDAANSNMRKISECYRNHP